MLWQRNVWFAWRESNNALWSFLDRSFAVFVFGTLLYWARATSVESQQDTQVLFSQLSSCLSMQKRLPTKKISVCPQCFYVFWLLKALPCVSWTNHQHSSIAFEASRTQAWVPFAVVDDRSMNACSSCENKKSAYWESAAKQLLLAAFAASANATPHNVHGHDSRTSLSHHSNFPLHTKPFSAQGLTL